MLVTLLLLHSDNMDAVYFWSALLIALLPIAVFAIIAVLAVRGYFRRGAPDGGGEPPVPSGGGRWRVILRSGASGLHR